MATQIKLRRGTANEWINANPILAIGEVGYETDANKIKIGDGTTSWNALNYVQSPNIGSASASSLIVSGSTSSDLVRITQTGTGNALVVEDSANPDSTPFVIDQSGNIGIGKTSPTVKIDMATDDSNGAMYIKTSQNGVAAIGFTRTRGTIASPTVVQINDILGNIGWSGYDGATDNVSALISVITTGTPTTGVIPSSMTFWTSASAIGPGERMRIDSSGNVGIGKTASAGIRLDVNGKGAFSDTLTAPTAAVDTNTTQVATTAFVLAQASGANPLALGSVAQGTSTRYARQDHVHPTTGLALLTGATFTGSVITPAATTSLSPIRIPHGTAPSAPTNGDIWTTTAGMYVQINGSTVGPLGTGGGGTTTNSNIIRFDSGTTEGTDIYTFNGSAAKNVNIVAGTNITLTKTSGTVTIASTGGGSASLADIFLLMGS